MTAATAIATAESLLATHLILQGAGGSVWIGDLDSFEQFLFDKVLEEVDADVAGDWCCEGSIVLCCDRGVVQIFGSTSV
jgi:hypothetical protein